MMGRRGCLAGLIAIAFTAALAFISLDCWLYPSSVTYRYRLTVEVETPQGLRSGSAVREVVVTPPGMMKNMWAQVRGEAVVVDLPDGQTLFALLPEDSFQDWLVPTVLYREGDYQREKALRSVRKAIANRTVAEVPRAIPAFSLHTIGHVSRDPGVLWPRMVRFKDIRNPKSVALIDPSDLPASFGLGYAIKRLTVQVTDDPVTTEIEKRLGWLDSGFPHIPISEYPPVGTPLPLFATLTKLDFIQGFSK